MQTAFMICMQEAGFFNSSLPTRTPATCRCFLCVKILTDYEAKLLLWIVEEVLSFREKASSLLSLLVFLFSLLFPSSLSPPFLLSHAFFPPSHPPVFPSICLSLLLYLEHRKLFRYLLLLHFYFNKCFASWRIIGIWFFFFLFGILCLCARINQLPGNPLYTNLIKKWIFKLFWLFHFNQASRLLENPLLHEKRRIFFVTTKW